MAKDSKTIPQNTGSKAEAAPRVVAVDGPGAPVFYANNVNIDLSNWDIRFRMGQVQGAGDNEVRVNEVAVVYMSHEHFRAFVAAATQAMAQLDKLPMIRAEARKD